MSLKTETACICLTIIAVTMLIMDGNIALMVAFNVAVIIAGLLGYKKRQSLEIAEKLLEEKPPG